MPLLLLSLASLAVGAFWAPHRRRPLAVVCLGGPAAAVAAITIGAAGGVAVGSAWPVIVALIAGYVACLVALGAGMAVMAGFITGSPPDGREIAVSLLGDVAVIAFGLVVPGIVKLLG